LTLRFWIDDPVVDAIRDAIEARVDYGQKTFALPDEPPVLCMELIEGDGCIRLTIGDPDVCDNYAESLAKAFRAAGEKLRKERQGQLGIDKPSGMC